ncbi:heavy metal sensor histidine kinase [Marinomonas pontica]|uniref:heavy metal sensor histidine kinase n=1 Tax=Marinomonas pontica TaxID=264739 RepID=UPI002242CA42|nr:heavy metal sensor histidine kinase [Marinomonas pontica]MCW8356282.1 heavy metal sensor histidine kinase [Marinomonas pontica]
MKTSSIASRLSIMFALCSMLTLSAYGLLLRSSLDDSLTKQMHNELIFRANLIEPWIGSRTSPDAWQRLVKKLADLTEAEGGRVKYWVFDSDSTVLLGDNSLTEMGQVPLTEGFSLISSNSAMSSDHYLYTTFTSFDDENKELRFSVSIDSTAYVGTLNEFTRTLVLISIFGISLVALLGFGISTMGMRPVKKLSLQAKTFEPGNYDKRLDTTQLPTELQTLAMSFNGVLDRQKVAWQQLESFNADVAHELRTPLTNLIGQTQLSLSHQHDIAELEDLLGSNLEELERMTSIVNDMLFMSHAQAGEIATQITTVSLHQEAQKTLDYIETLLEENNLTVEIEGDAIACIDHRLFHRALANLLGNGVQHARHNSTIKVTIQQDKNLASVAVSNQGEMIENQHLERLFERFYRVDSSRSGSHIHHGLGLSIVKAVALMHKGNVFVQSENGSNTFGFTLALDQENSDKNVS